MPVEAPTADGRVFAVVEVTSQISECSGAGGEHYVLAIDGTAQLAHAGGHAEYRKLAGFYVAELMMQPRTDEDHDRNPDSSRSGWCLDRLPRFDASALRLVPARDRAEAQRLLARIARSGMARPTFELGTHAARETIGVARVLDFRDGAVELEPIDGGVPAWVELPASNEPVLRGDPIVIASDAATAKPTRMFVADTIAGARAWGAAVRSHGWPPQPIVLVHGYALARWTAVGTVIADPRCGPTIAATEGRGSDFIAETLRAAAPANARIGETVLAVFVPRFAPDACGHTMRAVRVYRAPHGTDVEHGIPPGLTRLAE